LRSPLPFIYAGYKLKFYGRRRGGRSHYVTRNTGVRSGP